MKYSKNKESVAKNVFKSIATINSFETIDYTVHMHGMPLRNYFKFKFLVGIGSSLKMDKYLELNKIDVFEKTQKANKIAYLVVINKNKITNCFNALYHQSLPKVKPFNDQYFNINAPHRKVLVYKSVNEDDLKYEIIDENNLCEFIKNNPDIERALYLSTKSTYCYVEGTGCSCSQIEPLSPNEFSANDIIKIVKKIENLDR